MTELVNYLEAIYIKSKGMEPVELGCGCYRELARRYLTPKCSLFPGFFRLQYSEQNTTFHQPDLLPSSD